MQANKAVFTNTFASLDWKGASTTLRSSWTWKLVSSCSPIGATLAWQGMLGLDDADEGTGVTDLLLELLNSLTCFCSSLCFALSTFNLHLVRQNTCLPSWLGHALRTSRKMPWTNASIRPNIFLTHTKHLQPNNSSLWMHSVVGKAVKWHSRDLYFCYCRIHNTSDQPCRLVSQEHYNQFAWFKISHVRQSH